MYIDEFAARLHQLEDPYTDVQTRHNADQWLTQFRDSHQAWDTAQSALSRDPSLWPHAAQILAYKCKRQLAQIDTLEQRIAMLQTFSTALATLSSSLHSANTATAASSRAVSRGLCVAISNLILQIPTLPRPLEALGSVLDQQTMLEFLTILPGESEDAYSALQAATATDASESAFTLKQRAGEWCVEVGSWLYNVVKSIVQSNPQLAAILSGGTGGGDGGGGGRGSSTGGSITVVNLTAIVPSISCFAAWIKWGGLFSMAPEHWEYMLRLSAVILINGSGGGDLASPAVAAAVEALSEAIERPAPATQRVLLEICLQIAQTISIKFPLESTSSTNSTTSTHGTNISVQYYRHVTHVFTAYCSTNANIVSSATSEGAVLRNALLHLVALAGERAKRSDVDDEEDDEEESGGGGVPAVDCLGDILEAIIDSSLSSQHSLGEAASREANLEIGDGGEIDGNLNFPLLRGEEGMQYTSTVLSVLLQYSQAPLPYLLGSRRPALASEEATAVWLPSGLKCFRTQAEWPLWLCGEILLANTFVHQLYSFFQTRSTTNLTNTMNVTSTNSPESQQMTTTPAAAGDALQALEVCFYAIHKGASGAFSDSTSTVSDFSFKEMSSSPPPLPPPWLGPLLSLFAAAQELDPCRRHHVQNITTALTTPRLTIFHFSLLSAFATVAQPLMKAIIAMPEQCQGLLELIFTQSRAAIASFGTTQQLQQPHFDSFGSCADEDQFGIENESVVEAAAKAVRAALSSPVEVQTMALAAGAVGTIDAMVEALTTNANLNITSATTTATATPSTWYRRRDFAARKASQELLIALVHALYACDQRAAANAQGVVRNRALRPLITIATTAAEVTSNTSTLMPPSSSAQYVASLAMHFGLLHAYLEDTMALLNALESHVDAIDFLDGGCEQQNQQRVPVVVGAAVNDAVAACLTAWPHIMTALSQAASTGSGSSTISSISTFIYHDASQCLCSCIHLSPGSITPSLAPLVGSMYSTFFLPGGHSMHRILCTLLEMNLSSSSNAAINPLYFINILVTTTGSLLSAPAAQQFFSLGGGDSDPDAASAVLTIATCLLRQASSTQWNTILLSNNSTNSTTSTNNNGSPSAVVAPLIECVNLSLHLAAANAACNHRVVCQRAIATLSAAMVLMLDTSCTALHSQLLQLVCGTASSTNTTTSLVDSLSNSTTSGGVVIMQGILLCLLSLHSLSFLPKIMNLISDVAMLAVTCCCNVPPSPQEVSPDVGAMTHAAGSVLQDWWNKARINLEREGTRVAGAGGSGSSASATVAVAVQRESNLLNSLNWEPLVAAASASRVFNTGDSRESARAVSEAKRGIQRAVRQVADQIRKNQ